MKQAVLLCLVVLVVVLVQLSHSSREDSDTVTTATTTTAATTEKTNNNNKDELVFTSQEKLNEHIQNLNKQEQEKSKSKSNPQEEDKEDGEEEEESKQPDRIILDDEILDEKQKNQLRMDEIRARLEIEDAISQHGKKSNEYAFALQKLGRSLHKQHRYEEAVDIAKEIVGIHEKLDGVEHEKTAQALINLGSASYRIHRRQECEWAMNRALYILLKKYGDASNEVLLHRGRMLTFNIPHATTSSGLSYDDYLYEL